MVSYDTDSWGVAPGWYEPGHWPKIYSMPQSLSLVVTKQAGKSALPAENYV